MNPPIPWYCDPQWWHAIGAILAVVVGFATILKLFRKDKQREDQILKLAEWRCRKNYPW